MRWKDLFSPITHMDTKQVELFIESQPEGTYTLLDVRQPREYEKAHIPGSKLIPLPQLLNRVAELDPEKPVIVY
ncbi:rhodanese-like domain-containing protein [Desulfosarcina sp.]|uniref:rhodanese-like domain-containing protein n=1 Tax=Desulfosarcina sp. TaxID=2027861 RepID=UPI0029AD6FB4|nr:rhodanese-like domain-containing protein [Desulfosarcina sp.]MDX2455536.1 rhodanese-like domain-containing protein [Desulfosarcina sp.]MDX2493025.1 rhodanese-like domain-containing protein [Desulfosarcina sp.]